MPTPSGFDSLSGFSRTEPSIRDEKWCGLSQNLLLVTSVPTFEHFPIAFPVPWALIRRSHERCLYAVYYSSGAAVQSLVNISLFSASTGPLRALFLFPLFSTCICTETLSLNIGSVGKLGLVFFFLNFPSYLWFSPPCLHIFFLAHHSATVMSGPLP